MSIEWLARDYYVEKYTEERREKNWNLSLGCYNLYSCAFFCVWIFFLANSLNEMFFFRIEVKI